MDNTATDIAMKVTDGASAAGVDTTAYERQPPHSRFFIDDQSNPGGGFASGPGFSISWMDSPGEPWGSTLEDVLEVCAQRLRFFQSSRFACQENERALAGIASAIANLELRTEIRRQRGVEGTYEA